jgi:hypothetical protein
MRRAMGIVLTITAGLVVWIVLWALGSKAFDAFMITAVIALIGATIRILVPYFPGNRRS